MTGSDSVFTEDPSETPPQGGVAPLPALQCGLRLVTGFPEGQYGAGWGGNLTVDKAGQHHLSQVIKVPTNKSCAPVYPGYDGLRKPLLLGGSSLKPITPSNKEKHLANPNEGHPTEHVTSTSQNCQGQKQGKPGKLSQPRGT